MKSLVFIMSYTIYPLRGGLHDQVYLLSRELRRRGVKVGISYYAHGVLDKNTKFRLPLILSGVHPKLYSRLDEYEQIVMETAWPGLASFPIRLMNKEFTLHLHSIESLREFGLSWSRRYAITPVERLAGRLCKKILSVSLKEYVILRKIFGNKIRYVPLAVDLSECEGYKEKKEELREKYGLPKDEFIITFVGGMSYEPNREAAKVIATRISKEVYEKLKNKVLFMLVGPDPPKNIPNTRYLKVTGYVKSIAPYVAMSDLCIAPIYKGGGVKLKILNYMALEKPVIASRKAVEGMQIKPWIHYIPAEAPDEFVQAIVEATENIEYFNKTIAKSGYNYVHENHSLERVTDRFIEALEK